MVYKMLAITLIVIFIVDLSGFTQWWRMRLATWAKVKELRPLPPFDCSLCCVWWATIIASLVGGYFGLKSLCLSALLAFLALPIGQALMIARDAIVTLLSKLSKIIETL